MSATLADLVAIDGQVRGIRLYDRAPDDAAMPYITHEMKLTKTIYAGDAVLFRAWRRDLVLWCSETDAGLVAEVAGWLESHGLMGEAYHYQDDQSKCQYVVFETTVAESR